MTEPRILFFKAPFPANERRRLRRLEAQDRRNAAMHEAGHAVVLHVLGVQTEACIYPVTPTEDWHMFWCGYVDGNFRHLPGRDLALCAVAGAVAELAWELRDMPVAYGAVDWSDIIQDRYRMSAGDWTGMGDEPPAHRFTLSRFRAELACERLAPLFAPRRGVFWRYLLAEARRLIVASRSD